MAARDGREIKLTRELADAIAYRHADITAYALLTDDRRRRLR